MKRSTNRAFPLLLLSCVLVYSACSSTANQSSSSATSGPTNSAVPQPTPPRNASPFTGDGGKGIVLAVPAPTMKDATPADNWMPQLLQDIITGDLARYSAMTVLDRSNEQLVVAEQSLSVSGNYSDDDYIRIGNLTNAQYIVAGNILKVGGNYAVTFRINNTETNEIRASFNKTYPLQDIERGLASKEAVRELLAGMGIELTQAGETALLTIPEIEVKATARLAQGMAAEKNDNLVEALAFYTEAVGIAPGMQEASTHIQNFGATIQTSSIRERAEQAQREIAKWKKIFKDLETYVFENLGIAVYDFSTVADKLNVSANNVNFTITPGIQLVPDRTVLSVWKTVLDNWKVVFNAPENKSWVNDVSWNERGYGIGDVSAAGLGYGAIRLVYGANIGLYDDYGDRIGNTSITFTLEYSIGSSFQVLAQHKYFDAKKYKQINFVRIPLDAITDTVTPKVDSVMRRSYNVPIMTVAEWEQWLAAQGSR